MNRNTNELIKALRQLKVETGSLACFGCGHEHSCSVRGCAIIRAAEKALEKEKPRKPERAPGQIRYVPCYICPSCGKTFSAAGVAKYCYHCGQKLDWSEGEKLEQQV